MKNKKVIIEIRGGIPDIIRHPKGITIEIRDFDVMEETGKKIGGEDVEVSTFEK